MVVSEKRANEDEMVSVNIKKKAKLSYTLRDQLKTDKKVEVLKTFWESCKNAETRNSFIDEYLGHGGNCLELLHLLEENEINATNIFEIVYYVLLKILSNYPKLENPTLEACRYLLNTHITLINKMLSKTSKPKERKAVLKVLTAIVTFSPNLARDILLHINFNKDNIKLFCEHSNDSGDSVRNLYLRFLTAFLVDGHFPTISLFLEKPILLNHVINGLQYDDADTVCFFITTLKTKILENHLIHRTLKMMTFSTRVMDGFVKLYDWVGPKGSKSKNVKPQDMDVDNNEKDKVTECIHSFLIVLCTSHKYGIIFTDKTLGFGKKFMNTLLYTIIVSIKSPWDHIHKAELVKQSCIACPDLIRRVFDGLIQYFEPKDNHNWRCVVDFATDIIEQFSPECIECFLKDYNEQQILQVIRTLIIPSSILKKLINGSETSLLITNKILSLQCQMLKTTSTFLANFKIWYDKETYLSIKSCIQEYMLNYFSGAPSILSKLKIEHEETSQTLMLKVLELSLDILELYNNLCPPLLQNIPSTYNVENLLTIIEEFHGIDLDVSESLKMKSIKLFYIFDLKGFNAQNEIFSTSISIVWQNYFKIKDVETKNTLKSLLKFSGIFEGCDDEIYIWINAIFDFKKYRSSVVDFLCKIIKKAADNLIKYSIEIANIEDKYESYGQKDNIGSFLNAFSNETEINCFHSKNICYSPLILAALEELQIEKNSKYVYQYINFIIVNLFHLQTNPEPFIDLVIKNENILSHEVVTYVSSWRKVPIILTKDKGQIQHFSILSEAILSNSIKLIETCNFNDFDDLKLNILQMITFYITNLGENLTKDHYSIILQLTKTLIENNHNYILNNTRLMRIFSPTHTNTKDYKFLCTSYILEIIRMSQSSSNQIDLSQYRIKLSKSIMKVLNKFNNKSYPILKEVIEIINLDYQKSCTLVQKISVLNCSLFIQNDNTLSIIYDILTHVVKTLSSVDDSNKHLAPLSNEIVTKIITHFVYLNTINLNTSELSKVLLIFLKKYPHYFQILPEELFSSILDKNEYCRDNSNLAGEIFLNCPRFLHIYENSLTKISMHKGLFLLLLENAYELKVDENILKKAYNEFETSIIKALERPQKANQHFHLYYQGVCHLIRLFMPNQKAKPFLTKISKFECVEEFHICMLRAVYEKFPADPTRVHNAFGTFVHLITNLIKQQSKTTIESNKTELVVKVFIELIVNLKNKKYLQTNKIKYDETFKSFYILLLRYGLSEKHILINLLTKISTYVDLSEENAQEITAMMISHSDFFNYIFNHHNDTKKEVFDLFLVLIKRFPSIMSKEHLPFLLGAYSASINPSDVTILQILQCYESQPDKTNFFDFKPLLWGAAARNHYSLKSSVQSALWKQPKIADVLNILLKQFVKNTIFNYPLDLNFASQPMQTHTQLESASKIYDLAFLLPLFSQLLLPENDVQPLIFAKTGALSLIIIGLSCNNVKIRQASGHAMSRFYNHLCVNHQAKFNTLCIRFIEGLCRGTAAVKDFKLNHFSATFFALMSFVITNPADPMYMPLTMYLGSKVVLNLTTIPELYTFLHSSETNFMKQNLFILNLLKDGLRTKDDFVVFRNSKSQKLLLEYFSSAVSNSEIKNLVLCIFKKATAFDSSAATLCTNYGLIPFLNDIILNDNDSKLLTHVIDISHDLVQHKTASFKRLFLLYKLLLTNHVGINIDDDTKLKLLKDLLIIQKEEKLINADLIRNAAVLVKNKNFEYLYRFNYENYCKPNTDDFDYYIRELTKILLQ